MISREEVSGKMRETGESNQRLGWESDYTTMLVQQTEKKTVCNKRAFTTLISTKQAEHSVLQ